MAEHTPLMPHGDIEEVFPDVFFVMGTTRPNFGGANFQFSRNMTIARDKGALTLINTVRLDEDGLAHLDDLGNVEHVVKLGAFHGIDDAFYLERELGFIRPANIGPGWLRGCEPEASDFVRLKQLSFRHLLPAHGRPIRDQAHEQLNATFARDFNV